MKKAFIFNKIFKNASWIIVCKILQSILNLFIGMITVRYLGPSNYGLISYAASIAAFFVPIMHLGLTSTLVQELLSDPENEGKILGTSIGMNALTGVISMIGIYAFCMIAHQDEKETIIVCVLYSFTLLFQAAEMSQYWFQAKLMSKYPSIIALIAYIVASIYKIYILISNKDIYWFAITHVIEACVVSLSLMLVYYRLSDKKLGFSFALGKRLFSRSKYYIISGMAVIILQYTDKFMLKNMIGDEVTGYYSVAVMCAGLFSFVYAAIVDSMRPQILQQKKVSEKKYEESLSILYALIFYISLIQCIITTALADVLVFVLYGEAYMPAVEVLRVSVWVITFSFIGSVTSIWILGENKNRMIVWIGLFGAGTNILLNLIFIPRFGAVGAAFASFLTQLLKNFIFCFLVKPLRHSMTLLLRGINPKFAIKKIRELL